MDSNFQTCTFLASSTEICACSLVLVALLAIEFPPVIIDRGMRLMLLIAGSSSGDANGGSGAGHMA